MILPQNEIIGRGYRTDVLFGHDRLFYYQPVLTQALAPLVEQWDAQAIQALSRIWQIEADERRHPVPLVEQQARHKLWKESLDEAVALLGEEELWKAWDALSSVLGHSWRGSMLAECGNSLLRPALDGRKHTDQGCLELFRLLHNARPFERGKRADHSPAQLAGLDVPDDPLTLLGLAPKGETTENSHKLVAGSDPLPLTVAQAFDLSPDVETNPPFILMTLPHYALEGQEVLI